MHFTVQSVDHVEAFLCKFFYDLEYSNVLLKNKHGAKTVPVALQMKKKEKRKLSKI